MRGFPQTDRFRLLTELPSGGKADGAVLPGAPLPALAGHRQTPLQSQH